VNLSLQCPVRMNSLTINSATPRKSHDASLRWVAVFRGKASDAGAEAVPQGWSEGSRPASGFSMILVVMSSWMLVRAPPSQGTPSCKAIRVNSTTGAGGLLPKLILNPLKRIVSATQLRPRGESESLLKGRRYSGAVSPDVYDLDTACVPASRSNRGPRNPIRLRDGHQFGCAVLSP
jgi:hypothetical protein